MIEKHPTWDVLDSTKIQEYMSCPRRYFFKFIKGWNYATPSIHLEFGIAWHLAMEHLLLKGYTTDGIADAYLAFDEYYRKIFSPEMDEENSPKIPVNVFNALPQYVQMHAHDPHDFEVLGTEISGQIFIEDTLVVYRCDALIRHKEDKTYSVLEHKTVGNINKQWMNQWGNSVQIGMYMHMLYSHYSEDEVKGVIVNGASIKNPVRIKKDGTPYAGDKGTEFIRIPIKKSLKAMHAWYSNTSNWVADIKKDTEKIKNGTAVQDDCMTAFRLNPKACGNYFGCEYHDYCNAWINPLEKECPPEFIEKYWNPLEQKEG